MGQSMTVRRRRDGSVSIVGDLPDQHTFAARALARWLDMGIVEVTIALRPDQGDEAVYKVTGFEPHLDADGQPITGEDGEVKFNWTALTAERVPPTPARRGKKEVTDVGQ